MVWDYAIAVGGKQSNLRSCAVVFLGRGRKKSGWKETLFFSGIRRDHDQGRTSVLSSDSPIQRQSLATMWHLDDLKIVRLRDDEIRGHVACYSTVHVGKRTTPVWQEAIRQSRLGANNAPSVCRRQANKRWGKKKRRLPLLWPPTHSRCYWVPHAIRGHRL
jgi:hypothetical protein